MIRTAHWSTNTMLNRKAHITTDLNKAMNLRIIMNTQARIRHIIPLTLQAARRQPSVRSCSGCIRAARLSECNERSANTGASP